MTERDVVLGKGWIHRAHLRALPVDEAAMELVEVPMQGMVSYRLIQGLLALL